MLTERFDSAYAHAHQLHRDQVRKGTSIPYIAHLMAVAGLVLEHGGIEDEAIGALLHDAIEDQGAQGATRFEIDRQFGSAVVAIVEGCSDSDPDPERLWSPGSRGDIAPRAEAVPKLPWRERKERYLAHIAIASPSVRLVSSADKLHNARAILNDYRLLKEDLWCRFSAGRDDILWYYRGLVSAFQLPCSPPLTQELDRTVTELERLVGASLAVS